MPFSPSLALFTLASLLATGCASTMSSLDVTHLFEPEVPLKPGTPQVTLEMKPMSGAKETKQVALADGDSVEAVMIRSGAMRRFRQMEIQFYRPSAQTGPVVHPLKVQYDPGARRIPAQYDYAVQNGDKICVFERASNPVDDMLSEILGPFGSVED